MEQTKAITVQDKNFSTRLKAEVMRRMKEAGVTAAFLNGSKNYDEYERVERRFFQSLGDIKLSYLQGEESYQDYLNKKNGKNG